MHQHKQYFLVSIFSSFFYVLILHSAHINLMQFSREVFSIITQPQVTLDKKAG